MNSTRQSLQQRIDDFLRYLRVERKRSPVTIINYQRQLVILMDMAINMNINDWTQLETSHVRMMVAKCRQQGSHRQRLSLFVFRH